jgi:hypothetical protein
MWKEVVEAYLISLEGLVKTMQNLRTGGLHTKNIIMRFY